MALNQQCLKISGYSLYFFVEEIESPQNPRVWEGVGPGGEALRGPGEGFGGRAWGGSGRTLVPILPVDLRSAYRGLLWTASRQFPDHFQTTPGPFRDHSKTTSQTTPRPFPDHTPDTSQTSPRPLPDHSHTTTGLTCRGEVGWRRG